MLSPLIRTAQATGLRRSPWQTGQGRVSPSARFSKDFSAAKSASNWESKSLALGISLQTSPKPRQCSHHPWGELKEKSLGSSSSKDRPQSGQFISELRIRNSSEEASAIFLLTFGLAALAVLVVFAFALDDFSARGAGTGRAFAVPLPISRACLARSRIPFFAPFSIVPIRTSMLCSLKRSSGSKSSTPTSSPSTNRVEYPWSPAQRATSVWYPLRPRIRLAKSWMGESCAMASSSVATAVSELFWTATLQSGQCWVPSFE